MFKRRICVMILAALVLSVAGCAGAQTTGAEKSGETSQDASEAETTENETAENEAEEDELEEDPELLGEEEDEYTEEELEKMACLDVSEDSLSDFIVSDPKTNVIWFDLNNDQEDERITFEYNDLGEEAPSFIKVTIELPGGNVETNIEKAYALYWICMNEDEDGPLLDIGYETGDPTSHEDEGFCQLKLRDNKLIVDYEDFEE